MRAAEVRTLMPLEPKPMQVIQGRLQELRLAAIAVEVVVPINERPFGDCDPCSCGKKGGGVP